MSAAAASRRTPDPDPFAVTPSDRARLAALLVEEAARQVESLCGCVRGDLGLGHGALPAAALEVAVDLDGAIDATFTARFPEELVARAGIDALCELVNVAAGVTCGTLADGELDLDLTPPRHATPAPPRTLSPAAGVLVATLELPSLRARVLLLVTVD